MTVLRGTSRTEQGSGVEEIAEFYPVEGTEVFGFTHLPRGRPEAGLVICSPLHAEFIRNYRREVVIARRLAAAGIAVHRFHYRGQGNSGGDSDETTLDTMATDAAAAVGRLRELAAVDDIGAFGTRSGALIAAGIARGRVGTPIALWDPVLRASDHLHEVFRARRVQALSARKLSQRQAGLVELLERDGSVPVLGYSISRALYESSIDKSLETELGSEPRPVFLLRMGRDARTDKALSELVQRWRSGGSNVEDRSVGRREPWWFTSGEAVEKEALPAASDDTVDWITRRLSGDEVHG
jgi:hypothetical protein